MNDRTKIHSFIQQKLLHANITEIKRSLFCCLQSIEGQRLLIHDHNIVINAVLQVCIG